MRHLESQIQIGCVQWFRLAYPQLAILLFAVPNGGARKRVEGGDYESRGNTKGSGGFVAPIPIEILSRSMYRNEDPNR